ncbi:hypothetical protein J0H58_01845 [bacterium]|nr:hypothetical protein [bacterium]
MWLRLLAPLVALLAAGPAAAADPAVVFQTQPVGRVLNDARAVVAALAGPKEAGSIDEAIKGKLGPKGFTGLDINRPVLGYVHLPADPAKAVGVLVVPVTEEQAFLGFFERLTGVAPKAGAGGLYTVPAGDPGLTVGLRFADGHAYLAAGAKGGGDPAAVLAKDELVPVGKLHDPADQSLLAVRAHFDRLPKELRGQAKDLLGAAKLAAGTIPFPPEVEEPAGKAVGEALKLAERWLKLSEGAKEAAVRVTLDAAAADLGAELTVVPLPGSELGKEIAARRPTTNRFAGLVTPDAALGYTVRLPFFNAETKAAAGHGLDAALKAAGGLGGNGGNLFQELLKGAKRTVQTGEFDTAMAIRGPDKNGQFTNVQAIAFQDPAGVEKALKALVEADAPEDIRKAVKWNAEKVGGVGLHVLDLSKLDQQGVFGPEFKMFGGADAKLVAAFAPTAVYFAIGPDATAEVKRALALRPAEAPVVDVVINPARMRKLMTASGAPAREADGIAKTFGTDDRPVTLGHLTVTGGGELRVAARVNIRAFKDVLGREAHSTFEELPPKD